MYRTPEFSSSTHRPAVKQARLWAFGLWVGLVAGMATADTAITAERSATQLRLDALVEEISSDYPEVRHISVAELKRDFSGALLVDVRERDEYEMSHLPGAVHAPEAADVDALLSQHPNRALVFYCTVGIRSAIAATDYLARNRTDGTSTQIGPIQPHALTAVNLAGSIFAWANEGEPLVNSAGPTTQVHPFSTWWGLRYLEASPPD